MSHPTLSPLQDGVVQHNGSRRSPPSKENGDVNANNHAKKEPVSPRSGTSSSSSTPVPPTSNVKNVKNDDKQTTPKASPTDVALPAVPPLKPAGLGAPPFGLPGFPGEM